MGIKMPQFSRCCFCLPLRTGLLTLGYINLISHGLIFIMVVFSAFFLTLLTLTLGMGGVFIPFEWALLVPLVMGSEAVFNILVVVATNKKDARLLNLSFIVGTALWIFTVLYSICLTYRLGGALHSTDSEELEDRQYQLGICMVMSAVILDPIILGYVLLLVRSLKSMLRAEIPGLQYSDLNSNREAMADYERFQ